MTLVVENKMGDKDIIKTPGKIKRGLKGKKMKVTMIVVVVMFLLIGGFFGYGYFEDEKKENYESGGKDALTEIVSVVKESGGVVLEFTEDDKITLVKYQE